MKRNLKKILAVTLSMAMLTTSVTVNNIVTKADDNAGVAVMADVGRTLKLLHLIALQYEQIRMV